MKKARETKTKFKHPDRKTIGNIIDALLEIDREVLEKLA